MQKYCPQIWIQRLPRDFESGTDCLENLINPLEGRRAIFPETSFITVTAYQNQQVTLKLKSMRLHNMVSYI